MTDQERMNRESLLKKAAAVAGAVYFAPVLTSAALADTQECPTFLCKSKRKRKKCRKVPPGKGATCDCAVGQNCHPTGGGGCSQDPRCTSGGDPCAPLEPCGDGSCACFQCVGGGGAKNCMAFRSNFCSDYPPCSKADGSGCPPGHACYDSCCPEGICELPCSTGAAPRIARSVATGPRLTL